MNHVVTNSPIETARPILEANDVKTEDVARVALYEHWNTGRLYVIAHMKCGTSKLFKVDKDATATAA